MRCFLGFGGYIIEREGISTLSIRGFPWALSYFLRSLAFCFQLFEMVLLCVGLKMFRKEANVVATFVMIHVGMYTKVYLPFEKFSKFLKVVLKVYCDVCFFEK